MKRFICLSIILTMGMVCGYGFDFNKTSYEVMFQKLDDSRSNDIIKLLDEGLTKGRNSTTEMEFKQGFDLAYSAVKRIGELRLSTSKAKIKVKEVLQMSNPDINKDKAVLAAKIRYLFNVAIWALGRIGSDDDISLLVTYMPTMVKNESFYGDSIYFLILAFGEAYESEKALNALYELSRFCKSEELQRGVITAILKHNSILSLTYLIDLRDSRKSEFSSEFMIYINDAIDKLAKDGK